MNQILILCDSLDKKHLLVTSLLYLRLLEYKLLEDKDQD